MDGWNTTFLLGRPIFRGYVSFREGNFHLLDIFWKVFAPLYSATSNGKSTNAMQFVRGKTGREFGPNLDQAGFRFRAYGGWQRIPTLSCCYMWFLSREGRISSANKTSSFRP